MLPSVIVCGARNDYTEIAQRECPLLAQSRHHGSTDECPQADIGWTSRNVRLSGSHDGANYLNPTCVILLS
jgi:hypothetical protein